MLYNGFIFLFRFGSFEICKPCDPETGRNGPSEGNNEILQTLLDYTIETFYSHVSVMNNCCDG